MTAVNRSIAVFAFLAGTIFGQQKEVSGGYHVDHPDKPAATAVSNEKATAKKASKKKLHSNAKKSTPPR